MNYRVVLGLALSLFAVFPVRADDAYKLKTPYHTEEEWVISSICRNAYELLSVIADKKGEIISPDQVTVKKVGSEGVAYEVTLQAAKVTVDATLHWPGSIWSSEAYVPFCQAAIAQLKIAHVAPNDQASQGAPLATLLDFSEKSIEAENQRVSQWLNEQPDNPLAQQQAALVLGTLAMKENSGWFWDPREICNHVIAHLAVARSLQPTKPLSAEGQMAECIVGLIDDTKKECSAELDQMAKLPGAPKELAAWVTAGRMRNSRDWRILSQPENGSGFEQVEYFRALSEAVNVDQAINWMQTHSIANRPDWTRLVLEFAFSVDAGHTFAVPSVAAEIASMRDTFPKRYSESTMINDLNEAPEDVLVADGSGSQGLQVISSGMWAQFFQRHLCHAIVQTGDFLQNKWGVPDETAQFDTAVNNSFSGLTLYPYVQLANAILRKSPDDPEALLTSFTQHPEWAQDFIFAMPATRGLDMAQYQSLVRSWFSPPVLSGTAYDAVNRLDDVGMQLKTQLGAIDKLYAIAPLQFRVAELELTTRYSEHPSGEQVRQVMGPMVDYYLAAQKWASDAGDINLDQRVALEQKAAVMDPERYWYLAKDYLQAGRESDAANAYQQWYDKGTDRVAVSNEMEWLVNYYYDHGQKDKAMTIASYCAEVYSYDGLETMMHLLARMGQLDQAEDYGQKIKDRYNDAVPLIAFYHAEADKGNASYQAKFDDAVLTVFPYGIKKVTLASFYGAPTSGMQFRQTSDSMAKNGLSSNQVVVALDGYQVENMDEYTLVRAFSDSPVMTFIVWDGKSYREIKANMPGRRFGVDTQNYTK